MPPALQKLLRTSQSYRPPFCSTEMCNRCQNSTKEKKVFDFLTEVSDQQHHNPEIIRYISEQSVFTVIKMNISYDSFCRVHSNEDSNTLSGTVSPALRKNGIYYLLLKSLKKRCSKCSDRTNLHLVNPANPYIFFQKTFMYFLRQKNILLFFKRKYMFDSINERITWNQFDHRC